MSIEKTIEERGTRYGDFSDHASLAQGIQFRMQKFFLKADNPDGYIEPWKDKLNDVQRQALTVIADKIARILSGDPNYADNWHDIQGYARLVEERLPKSDDRHPMTPNVLEFDEARIDRIASSHGDGEHYAEIAGAKRAEVNAVLHAEQDRLFVDAARQRHTCSACGQGHALHKCGLGGER